VLGVETDQDLIPQSFQQRVVDGARIATFGRWIVDCGHEDFHTEIHPPLLMAVATPAPPGIDGASEMTHVEIMSRPYTVSQKWDEGNFVNHLLAEVRKVETTILGIPLSTRVEAHPTVFTTPYQGRPFIELLVEPPVPRREPGGPQQRLTVNFHFTHRSGVALQVFDAGNDTVGIIVVLGDLSPAQLPPKHDLTVQWSELGSEYPLIIDALQIADILNSSIASAVILNRGILTDRYDAPSASSPLDNQNVAAPVEIGQLRPGVGFAEDNDQPFPIYGWLDVWWQEGPVLPLPRIAVEPKALRFGKVAIGVAVSRSFRIDNIGNADLTVTIPGPESGYAWNQGTTTLPPGAGMDVDVTFEPTSTGDGGVSSLTVQTNAANGDQVVQLTSSVAGGPPP
jgi:hypothetical protein